MRKVRVAVALGGNWDDIKGGLWVCGVRRMKYVKVITDKRYFSVPVAGYECLLVEAEGSDEKVDGVMVAMLNE